MKITVKTMDLEDFKAMLGEVKETIIKEVDMEIVMKPDIKEMENQEKEEAIITEAVQMEIQITETITNKCKEEARIIMNMIVKIIAQIVKILARIVKIIAQLNFKMMLEIQ